MNRSLCSLLTAGVFALGLTVSLAAAPAEADNPEARLRDTLRTTMLQLRSTQNDLASSQAALFALTEEKKAVVAQNDVLKKQAVADHMEAGKAIADLKLVNVGHVDDIARLTEALAKTKIALDQASALARAKEDERARVASELIVAQRRGDDLHAKNLALYKTGNEILLRYEKFSLGDALSAREPFVGLTRVKMENFVQDYADKLAEQRAANP